ncbi:hypothetical protein PV327_011386 [Microctonus hyperodae]|uniref:Uncharacterized protein n=1 Tax=Microctonus hyperodae TaxID=165561 RepID=A0AA39EZQ6_MICHY|nr:hypothetical protein PV327_011386 [Microctonus hyperodae]
MDNQNALLLLKSNNPAPTVEQMNSDRIIQLANNHWALCRVESHPPFKPQIVGDIYIQEICTSKCSIRRIMMTRNCV